MGDATAAAKQGKGAAKMKAKVKKRLIGCALGGTLGVGALGAGLFGGPAMLLNTITAKMTDGIMNVQQSIMTNHSVRIYQGSLTTAMHSLRVTIVT